MLRSFGRARLNNAAALATFAALALTSLAMAFPKPAPVPYRWELNFEAGPLRLYTDPGGTGSYWYFTYTVTNRTNKDQLWAPKMVLFTDTGDILPAGKDVPTAVTNGLLELLGNEFATTFHLYVMDARPFFDYARLQVESLAVDSLRAALLQHLP